MNAVTPVAPQTPVPLQSAADAVSPLPQNGLTAEQRLLDYIARFQAEGLARGQHLGNPAAMSGEALKSLKGYFERATALQDRASGKVGAMSESADGVMANTESQLPALPGGPARERLEPARNAEGPAQRVDSISDAELNRTVDALMEVLRYSMETSMITTATGNISKSATTLTRGQ